MTSPQWSEFRSPARPFLFVWLGYSLIVLLAIRFLMFPAGFAERMDFRQLYSAAYLLRTNAQGLYDYDQQKKVQDALVSKVDGLLPFVRPAYEAPLFVPLSHFTYRTAYLLYVSISLFLLAACFFICPQALARPGTTAQPKPGLQLFAFFPVLVTILQGQDSIVVLLGLCVVYRCLDASRELAAGMVLGLLLFKFQITLPVALFLITRYGFSFLAGFAVSGLLVTGTSIALTGWSAFTAFSRVLLLTGTANLAQNTANGVLGIIPLAMPNLKGLISGILNTFVTGRSLLLTTLGISALLTILIMHQLRSRKPDAALSFSLAVTGAILLSYYLHIQDLSVLLLPLGLTSGFPNSTLRRALWLFYVAPPLLVMIGRNTIFLLALPVIALLYGILQVVSTSSLRISR